MYTISAQWLDPNTLRITASEWYRAQRYPRTLFTFDLTDAARSGTAHGVCRDVAAAVVHLLDVDPSFGA
jgi:hypothetical protein